MHYVLQQMHLLRKLLLSTASCCFCCFFSLQVVFKIEVNSKSLFALWQHVFSRPPVYFKLPTFVLDRVLSPANLKKNKSRKCSELGCIFWVELSAQTGCCHVRSDIIKSEYSPARQWGLQPALECLITAPFNSAQDGGSHSSKLLQKYN